MKRTFKSLKEELSFWLEQPLLNQEWVCSACGRLTDELAESRLLPEGVAKRLSREHLNIRIERELGAGLYGSRLFPRGVLLHIGAGNTPGLGAYSVILGLLTGNINLLKPASGDRDVSFYILKRLAELEPVLRPYIHVFSLSSEDRGRLLRLAELSDGAVVWGGNEAVSSLRRLLPPEKPLVQWGHKASYAYAAPSFGTVWENGLTALARHIIETEQRFCNSCQGIFLDTEKKSELEHFYHEFEAIYRKELKTLPNWEAARKTLSAYTAALEQRHPYMVGGCFVAMLPRKRLIDRLHPYSGILQTIGLCCNPDEWEKLSYLLLRAGVVRVCRLEELGTPAPMDSHDGEWELLRYCRVVEGG